MALLANRSVLGSEGMGSTYTCNLNSSFANIYTWLLQLYHVLKNKMRVTIKLAFVQVVLPMQAEKFSTPGNMASLTGYTSITT